MKKAGLAVLLMLLGVVAAFANGNGERLSTIEGTAQFSPGPAGRQQLMIRAANGREFLVDMPEREIARLQLQNQERIRVRGVVVDEGTGAQVQSRIAARLVTAKGQDIEVENPVRLTERDRERVRLYDGDGEQTQMQTQTQTQTRTQSQSGSGSGSGGKAGNGQR
jgi:hypothetical protein